MPPSLLGLRSDKPKDAVTALLQHLISLLVKGGDYEIRLFVDYGCAMRAPDLPDGQCPVVLRVSAEGLVDVAPLVACVLGSAAAARTKREWLRYLSSDSRCIALFDLAARACRGRTSGCA